MNPAIQSKILSELHEQAKFDWLNLGSIYDVLQDHFDVESWAAKEKVNLILAVLKMLLDSGDFQVIRMESSLKSGYEIIEESSSETLERVRSDCLIYGLSSSWFSGLLRMKR